MASSWWRKLFAAHGVQVAPSESLSTAIEAFVRAIHDDKSWVDELNAHSRNVARFFPTAGAAEIADALQRLNITLQNVPVVALGHVAITCGSLVEGGGDPQIAGPSLLKWLTWVNESAIDFYARCRPMAESDTSLLAELRAKAVANGDMETSALPPAALVEAHVADEGWQELSARFGPTIYKTHPESVLGYMADEFFRLGLIAHLSRSKTLRTDAHAGSEYLESTRKADDAAGTLEKFLFTMLRVIDDEALLVLHVEQRKGFEIRIGGIADNFQLHTLLAGAIVGSSADDVRGEAPSVRAVAQCRDAVVSAAGGDPVVGAFNLCNWTALTSDGHLSADPKDSAHWIWNEGCPADIVSFDGRRIVLLGNPPYTRTWRAGRMFPGMSAELTIERRLSDAETAQWLERLMRADRSPAGIN